MPGIFQDWHGGNMSKDEDKLLVEQIEGAADEVARTKATNADLDGMAAAYNSHFPHRSQAEIFELLKSAWRRRGLSWDGM